MMFWIAGRKAVCPGVVRWPMRLMVLVLMALTAGCTVSSGVKENDERRGALTETEKAALDSSRAFLMAYDVLMHPRCLNCHPAGNRPLQGDDSRPHGQNVQRGETGHGKYALSCTNCHQDTNAPGLNAPPGIPNWHMPPPEMPMVFEGRSPAELCRQLQDPEHNNNMDLAEIMTHVEDDPLVLWGWNPGEGRTLPPLSHAQFVRAMAEWIDKGAACPE